MANEKEKKKFKEFKENVDKPTDMFGKPQEIPVAKDNVLIGGPKPLNIQPQYDSSFKPAKNEVGNEYTPLYQIVEQGKEGVKYLGNMFLKGAQKYIDSM